MGKRGNTQSLPLEKTRRCREDCSLRASFKEEVRREGQDTECGEHEAHSDLFFKRVPIEQILCVNRSVDFPDEVDLHDDPENIREEESAESNESQQYILSRTEGAI